jgi:hypothetical protein
VVLTVDEPEGILSSLVCKGFVQVPKEFELKNPQQSVGFWPTMISGNDGL